MRRLLRRDLPLLSAVYQLKPWDLERLTFDEIEEYRRQLPDVKRALGRVELVEYK